MLNLYTSLIFIVFGPLVLQEYFTLSTDPINGVFGWMQKENIFYSLVVVSLINGVGTIGLQYLVFQ